MNTNEDKKKLTPEEKANLLAEAMAAAKGRDAPGALANRAHPALWP